jgi:hypothetical protein
MYILRGTLNGDQIRDALVKALPTSCRGHRQIPPVICHISRDEALCQLWGKRRHRLSHSSTTIR